MGGKEVKLEDGIVTLLQLIFVQE